ncbi:hypothetical protein [Kribbella soli]|uniref:Uncharacterized protein n=1 Tax=Kribbella soli TaxID=1124743 RepID=A0A4R0H0V9_9ACTN|nr:hypothetical protein [Kribbella soli]TCC01329.1 hypothetical protein E0H45_42170 [Kribbella soli]
MASGATARRGWAKQQQRERQADAPEPPCRCDGVHVCLSCYSKLGLVERERAQRRAGVRVKPPYSR